MPERFSRRNVYVWGIPPGFSQAELQAKFSSFGSIKSVAVFPPRPNTVLLAYDVVQSGYGFVRFYHSSAARDVVSQFYHPLLRVNYAKLKLGVPSSDDSDDDDVSVSHCFAQGSKAV